MVCPKCNEETLVKVKFRKTNSIAYFCDTCETFWFEEEEINLNTGHLINSRPDILEEDFEREEPEQKTGENIPAEVVYK